MKRLEGKRLATTGGTGVIDGIAFQIHILALNAAVEAARARGQGRGRQQSCRRTAIGYPRSDLPRAS